MRRVALLGGSSAFTPALAAALCARARELPELELVVFGRDAARSANVARACAAVARARDAAHAWSATTELDAALTGADVVVNQVRPGGFAAREHDERFPLAFDLPGDETLGPGALAAAVRGAPLVLALARASMRQAPRAWFVQLSNPMSMLLAGLQELEGLRAFGLCELPGDTLVRALALLGLARADVDVDYAGLNHQGFFHRVERGGEDLLPALFAALEARVEPGFFRLPVARLRALGALALPYLEQEYEREAALRRQRARGESRARELSELSARLHARYAADAGAVLPPELTARATPWFDQALVPALVALLGGPPAELYVTERNGAHLSALPPAALVEKRALVTRDGPRAFPLRRQPPAALAARLAALERFEALGARCALAPDAERAAAALAAHPGAFGAATVRALVPHVLAARGVPA